MHFLLRFTPMEPYFLGGERNYSFPGFSSKHQKAGSYYISSEMMPSQTTMFGVLRYLAMPIKHPSLIFSEEEKKKTAEYIGERSLDISMTEAQDFGKIQSISPVFLMSGDQYYFSMPLDHTKGEPEQPNTTYSPFREYENIATNDGMREIPTEYDVKNVIFDGFVSCDGDVLIESGKIFQSIVRTRNSTSYIQRSNQDNESSLYKKEYKMLNKGWSFAIFADVDEEIFANNADKKHLVYLGQGKSAFSVTIEKSENDLCPKMQKLMSKNDSNTVYLASDTWINPDLLKKCISVFANTKSYRAFSTHYGTSHKKSYVKKGKDLYTALKAGSILRAANAQELCDDLMQHHLYKAGFNYAIAGGGEK